MATTTREWRGEGNGWCLAGSAAAAAAVPECAYGMWYRRPRGPRLCSNGCPVTATMFTMVRNTGERWQQGACRRAASAERAGGRGAAAVPHTLPASTPYLRL